MKLQGIFAQSLNDLSAYCHQANAKWWIDIDTGLFKPQNVGEKFMLIVSEIAEAMEGERKNLMDDHLPHRKMVEVVLADALIRIFDYAGAYGMDLGGALVEKLAYNKIRADHSTAARLGVNGKRF